MIGVTVNFLDELCHDPQLSRVSAEVNIEVFQVVLRAMPPIGGVVGNVVRVVNDWPFAILRAGGSVEIKAVQPNAVAIEHFTSMLLVNRCRRARQIEIQINRNSGRISLRFTTIS